MSIFQLSILLIWIPFMLLIMLSTVFLAKRKTNTPNLAIGLSFLLSFVPPVGLLFLALLVLKNDIQPPSTPHMGEKLINHETAP